MRVLHIFDIGSFVHAGAVNTHSFIEGPILKGADGYRSVTIQTGGVAQILNTLADIDPEETCIFCADRRPTIKQGMLTSYKENREHRRNVENQKEIIEIILNDCGYDVLFEEGYEADDFIYSLVQKFKDSYDMIHVYTGDSDLYFLVCENVDIRPSNSRAKHVTMENYSYTVSSKTSIPYNAVTFNKIVGGDRSDCIPALSKEAQKTLGGISRATNLYKYLGDKEFLKSIAEGVHPDFAKQLELVFPLSVNVPSELVNKSDYSKVKTWGGITRAKRFARVSKIPDEFQAVIDEIIARQLYED